MSALPSNDLKLRDLQQALGGSTNPYRLSNYYATRTKGVGRKTTNQQLAMSTFKGLILAYPTTARQLAPVNVATTIAAAIDSQGNIYITGDYTSSVVAQVLNLDGTNATSGGSNLTLPATISSDVFLLKYNQEGFCLSAANILPGNGSSGDVGWAISIDDFDNIFIAGQYHQTTSNVTIRNFDGSNSSMVLPPSTGLDAFILKYNLAGVCLGGANILSGTGSDKITTLTIENCDASSNYNPNASYIYCAGSYTSTSSVSIKAIVAAGAAASTSSASLVASSANGDGFIIKYNIGTGQVESACNLFGTGSDVKQILFKKYDTGTIMYCTGRYVSSAVTTIKSLSSTGGVASSVTVQASNSSNKDDAYILKYNPSTGACIGSCALVSSGSYDSGVAMTVDDQGTMYCTGQYTSTSAVPISNFLPNASSNTINLPSSSGASGTDVFVLKFNSNGVIIKLGNILRGSGGTAIQTPYAIYADSVSGFYYIAGTFNSSSPVRNLTTDGTEVSSAVTLTSTNGLDGFIIKYQLSTDTCVAGCTCLSGTGTDSVQVILPILKNVYFIGRTLSTTAPIIRDYTNLALNIAPALQATAGVTFPILLRYSI